ncbi:phospholipase B1, membrane-associated-like [Antedon mediterranea]|uniref:phospholipase B1, membrane-associated-like n=1 Tax=Antedon mediterranea TaxID=105859 RepID=UPI003AF55B5E
MATMLKCVLFAILMVEAHSISLENADKNMINRLAEYISSEDCDDSRVDTSSEPTGVPCNCEVFKSDKIPTSVHELRPSDIKVIGAIGDGITAGSSAGSDSILDTLTEYRELSFLAGGQDNVETIVTLPNILKKFNPSLVGFSTERSIGLNVAETGARLNELACQAAELIDMMKSDKRINYEQDWKMVTILVGGNDFCNYCVDKDDATSSDFISAMYEALELLMDEMPRVFINIVSTVNPHDLSTIASQGSVCTTVYMKSCPCVTAGTEIVAQVHTAMEKYQDLLNSLIETGRYEKNDFTVVVQPYLQNQVADKSVEMSLMSQDCINLNKKGQAVYAMGLWRSMFSSIKGKPTDLRTAVNLGSSYSLEGAEIYCPSENQYFVTSTNSGSATFSANSFDTMAVDDSSSSSNGAIVAVSVIGGCICLVAIIAGVIGYRRVRQRQGYSEPEGHPMMSSSAGYTKFS